MLASTDIYEQRKVLPRDFIFVSFLSDIAVLLCVCFLHHYVHLSSPSFVSRLPTVLCVCGMIMSTLQNDSRLMRVVHLQKMRIRILIQFLMRFLPSLYYYYKLKSEYCVGIKNESRFEMSLINI